MAHVDHLGRVTVDFEPEPDKRRGLYDSYFILFFSVEKLIYKLLGYLFSVQCHSMIV